MYEHEVWTWSIGTDCYKMEEIDKYKTSVQYHKKHLFLKKNKSFSSNVKQSSFFLWMIAFLKVWINTPSPTWEIHMNWENDI